MYSHLITMINFIKPYNVTYNTDTIYKEAEYTFRLRKKIIPLRLQPKYHPDGWLGILGGSQLVFDCSLQNKIDNSIRNLVRELRGQGKKQLFLEYIVKKHTRKTYKLIAPFYRIRK